MEGLCVEIALWNGNCWTSNWYCTRYLYIMSVNKSFFHNFKLHSKSKITNYLKSFQVEIIQHQMRQKDDYEGWMVRAWKEAVLSYLTVRIISSPIICWTECQWLSPICLTEHDTDILQLAVQIFFKHILYDFALAFHLFQTQTSLQSFSHFGYTPQS